MYLTNICTHDEWIGMKPGCGTGRYSVTYSGTESPVKREKPNMNFVLKLFKLQNCSKPRPAEAASKKQLIFTHNHPVF